MAAPQYSAEPRKRLASQVLVWMYEQGKPPSE